MRSIFSDHATSREVTAAMGRSHCEERQCQLLTGSRSIVGQQAQFRARCGIGQHAERIP
jgi:hypothetical protein